MGRFTRPAAHTTLPMSAFTSGSCSDDQYADLSAGGAAAWGASECEGALAKPPPAPEALSPLPPEGGGARALGASARPLEGAREICPWSLASDAVREKVSDALERMDDVREKARTIDFSSVLSPMRMKGVSMVRCTLRTALRSSDRHSGSCIGVRSYARIQAFVFRWGRERHRPGE